MVPLGDFMTAASLQNALYLTWGEGARLPTASQVPSWMDAPAGEEAPSHVAASSYADVAFVTPGTTHCAPIWSTGPVAK